MSAAYLDLKKKEEVLCKQQRFLEADEIQRKQKKLEKKQLLKYEEVKDSKVKQILEHKEKELEVIRDTLVMK